MGVVTPFITSWGPPLYERDDLRVNHQHENQELTNRWDYVCDSYIGRDCAFRRPCDLIPVSHMFVISGHAKPNSSSYGKVGSFHFQPIFPGLKKIITNCHTSSILTETTTILISQLGGFNCRPMGQLPARPWVPCIHSSALPSDQYSWDKIRSQVVPPPLG